MYWYAMNTVAKKHFEFWFDPLSQQNTPFSACGLKLGLFMSWPNVNELPIYIEMDLTWNILVVICLGQKVPNHTTPPPSSSKPSKIHENSVWTTWERMLFLIVAHSAVYFLLAVKLTFIVHVCSFLFLHPFYLYIFGVFFSLFFSSVLFLFIKHPCVLSVYTIHWLYM